MVSPNFVFCTFRNRTQSYLGVSIFLCPRPREAVDMYLHVSDWVSGARVAGSANDAEALKDVKACTEHPP